MKWEGVSLRRGEMRYRLREGQDCEMVGKKGVEEVWRLAALGSAYWDLTAPQVATLHHPASRRSTIGILRLLRVVPPGVLETEIKEIQAFASFRCFFPVLSLLSSFLFL